MFKNMYLLLIGVFAMMLVGFLNVSDSEEIVVIPNGEPINNILEVNFETITSNGFTISHDNNVITVNGTGTETDFYFNLLDGSVSITDYNALFSTSYFTFDSSTDYVLSTNKLSGTYTADVKLYIKDDSGVSFVSFSPISLYKEGTFLTDTTNLSGWVYIKLFGTYDTYSFNIQLEEGTTATEYVSYNDGEDEEVLMVVNGTDDYISSIIKASPYLVSLFVIIGVVSYLVTGKKEDD